MSAREGDPWFVSRQRPHPGASANRSRRGIYPVSRAGWIAMFACIGIEALFIVGAVALALSGASIWLVAGILIFGIVFCLSFLLLLIYRRTDYSITLEEWRARQSQDG